MGLDQALQRLALENQRPGRAAGRGRFNRFGDTRVGPSVAGTDQWLRFTARKCTEMRQLVLWRSIACQCDHVGLEWLAP